MIFFRFLRDHIVQKLKLTSLAMVYKFPVGTYILGTGLVVTNLSRLMSYVVPNS